MQRVRPPSADELSLTSLLVEDTNNRLKSLQGVPSGGITINTISTSASTTKRLVPTIAVSLNQTLNELTVDKLNGPLRFKNNEDNDLTSSLTIISPRIRTSTMMKGNTPSVNDSPDLSPVHVRNEVKFNKLFKISIKCLKMVVYYYLFLVHYNEK